MNRPSPEELARQGLCSVHQFKDDVCGYEGPERWCDRTRARCRALRNEPRFDGAMPPKIRPRSLPWWTFSATLGILATLFFVESWPVAGCLYTFFAILLVPNARGRIYYRMCQAARLAPSEDTAQAED